MQLLKAKAADMLDGTVGIAHNRWATHGGAEEKNAHPHVSGNISVIHNRQITNYLALKSRFIAKGCVFTSDTGTEVLAHLIRVGYVDNDRELADGDIAEVAPKGITQLINITNEQVEYSEYTINPEHYRVLEKKHEYWMYDEIMPAPEIIMRALQNG